MEKSKTEETLNQINRERQQYQQENTTLNMLSGQFKKRLDDIERQQAMLLNEKRHVEKLYIYF
jgi:hypothetical protein